jgi:hypothetical protein
MNHFIIKENHKKIKGKNGIERKEIEGFRKVLFLILLRPFYY